MYKFKMAKLNCMGCFRGILAALNEFDSSIKAEADVENKVVSVWSTESAEKLTSLMEIAGYPVVSVSKD